MSRRQEAGVSPEERRRARETAHSMYEGRGINKDEIARVIGAESKYERLVCMYYLQLFDFKAQDIVSAIRRFLSHFALNAEAQEIDRIMYSFAERYCEQNPTEYSVDAIHALAMAILLLNTDLHTPNNTRRMRQDQFIYNLAALNDGADFPRQLLQDIYNSIKAEQLVPVATHDKTAASHGAQQDNAGRPSFSVLRGRPSRVLDAFFLGEPIEPPTLEEIIQQKDTFDAFQARTSFRHRAWRTLHAAICGRYLIFHKSSFQPRSIQDYGHNVYDVVLLYHAFCRRALEYTKRDHVFELTTATGRRMLFTVPTSGSMDNWITRINTIAATSSAPPLPAPATSQRGFQRPVLPMSRSSETLEEQVARYRAQLRQLRDQLSVHQSEERAAKSQGKRSWQQWETKQEYLEFELQRVATYFDILNAMHKTSDALTLRRLRSQDETTISVSSPRRLRDRYLVMPQHSRPQVSWV